MLNELADADIAICEILHSYSGWVVPSRNGSGLLDRARFSGRQVPWTGLNSDRDQDYMH
jgi:hypothetical protein